MSKEVFYHSEVARLRTELTRLLKESSEIEKDMKKLGQSLEATLATACGLRHVDHCPVNDNAIELIRKRMAKNMAWRLALKEESEKLLKNVLCFTLNK